MNTEKNHQIDQILTSLDHHPKVQAPDFFYTRLRARMEKEMERKTNKPWILRPAFALLAIVLVLVINATIIFQGGDNDDSTVVNDTETVQSIATEYSLNDNPILYDLNP